MYFTMLYNYGFVDLGSYYVQAKNKAEATRKAKKRGLKFLTEPKRITKEEYLRRIDKCSE